MSLAAKNIGYYLASINYSNTVDDVYGSFSSLVDSVGYTSFQLSELSANTLADLDILWVERPYRWYSQDTNLVSAYQSALDSSVLTDFLDNGGNLIYNDWTKRLDSS